MIPIRVNNFKHAVTIRTSPSKPQVICTPRRRATTDRFETTTPVYPGRGLPFPYPPQTPPPSLASPESVVDLGIGSVADKSCDEGYIRIKARPTWTQRTSYSNPSSITTVRRVLPDKHSRNRADKPSSTAPDRLQLTQVTLWIIAELEGFVDSIPQVSLQLDSPVILQICLPAGQRRVSRSTLPTLPLSRSSKLHGPLSSHPIHSPRKDHLQAISPPFPPTSPAELRSLRVIFPHASSQLLSSLQATYLALRYISTIRLPPPSSCFPLSLYTKTHSPLSTNMPYIPAKARAMLGLQTPTTRPALPASWPRPEIRGWRQRIKDLECKLEKEVVRFTRMCEGSDLGKNEALVRAIAEIIDFELSSRRSSGIDRNEH